MIYKITYYKSKTLGYRILKKSSINVNFIFLQKLKFWKLFIKGQWSMLSVETPLYAKITWLSVKKKMPRLCTFYMRPVHALLMNLQIVCTRGRWLRPSWLAVDLLTHMQQRNNVKSSFRRHTAGHIWCWLGRFRRCTSIPLSQYPTWRVLSRVLFNEHVCVFNILRFSSLQPCQHNF